MRQWRESERLLIIMIVCSNNICLLDWKKVEREIFDPNKVPSVRRGKMHDEVLHTYTAGHDGWSPREREKRHVHRAHHTLHLQCVIMILIHHHPTRNCKRGTMSSFDTKQTQPSGSRVVGCCFKTLQLEHFSKLHNKLNCETVPKTHVS